MHYWTQFEEQHIFKVKKIEGDNLKLWNIILKITYKNICSYPIIYNFQLKDQWIWMDSNSISSDVQCSIIDSRVKCYVNLKLGGSS